MAKKKADPASIEVHDPKVISFFSKEALATLSNELILYDGRPRYSDEILKAFEDLLEKRIQDKESDIKRKKDDLKELRYSLIGKKPFEDYDHAHDINQAEKVLVADEKVLKELRFALSRAKHKTFGICFNLRMLIPLEQLLANPISKYLVVHNQRCVG
ncbi:hypothetical protein KC866_01760 [Patescibacteria group bacterium]|nr:hypothetical protein [Patescibacteria group bacterium]